MAQQAAGMAVTGLGSAPLDHLVQQLWQRQVDRGTVRVVVDPAPDPTWRDAESYWVLPGPATARLLVPAAGRKPAAASLHNYGRLRPWKTRVAREFLAAATLAGLVPGRGRLSVQVRTGAEGDRVAAGLPLAVISSQLGRGPGPRGRLYCSMGIRTGDNRKPTLQLIDGAGNPAGYAKLAWNAGSSEFIETETAVLSSVGPRRSAMRAPELLCSGTQGGFPFLVTAPLPADVRAVRGAVAAPTPAELYSLCPVERVDTVASTRHFQALLDRLATLSAAPGGASGGASGGALAASTGSLAAAVRGRDARLPVGARWHGDLVPWNTARDSAGQLWCWDWESAEADAAAGLDAVHWMFSVRRENRSGAVARNLQAAVNDAHLHLHAAGVRRDNWPDLAGIYALVVAERAWTLAAAQGSWANAWISKAELVDLVDSARKWIDAVSHR
ncbi:hypothetical protein [Arthrobacter sp. STN4]|uniref:hypothetical protein n=1 Tax=Arthrobacter sp. STN4 TaxID=2923276 RepID=UPI002119D35B|nr:hypothetical protein [Arthrobacter sp. STN4]MCQ9163647.1 hypothetical protein [Arthrobacter sp. STN4]